MFQKFRTKGLQLFYLYVYLQGLQAIERHVRRRRVTLTRQDLVTILSSENPFICKLSPLAQEVVYAMGEYR